MSSSDRTDYDSLTADVAEYVDEACDQFEQAWKDGDQPSIQERVAQAPEPVRNVLRQELLRVELAYRHKLGLPISEEEYLGRFPDLEIEWFRQAASRSKPKRETISGTLGDFRLLDEIGRGGMGVVYSAVQISLGRRVAVKILPSAATMDSRQLKRFQNEARAAASLNHPNIVPVFAVGCERSLNYYAMQLIDGHTLSQSIKQIAVSTEGDRTLPSATVVDVSSFGNGQRSQSTSSPFQTSRSPSSLAPTHYRRVAEQGIQIADALEHAHSMGIVHRDIKPGNLMLDRTGKLWVTDFGLARIAATEMSLTISGDMMGTLRYMSPEQALAKHGVVDHRTDIYSLGVTLYELLTLRPAIEGKDRGEILQKIAFEEPLSPRKLNPAIPHDLETIVLKAIAKEPHLRYQTAEEFSDDLRRFLEDRPIKARRRTTWQSLVRWQRRNRAVAAALALTMTVIVVANGLVTWKWREERAAHTAARLAEQKANERADELLQSVYLQRIARAEQEWWSNNVGRAEQILDRCPPELRHWEWSYLKRRCSSEIRKFSGADGELRGIAFSPDGRHLAAGGVSGNIHLWDIATGSSRTLPGHTTRIQAITFRADGQLMASAATVWGNNMPGEVKVWDIATGEEVANFPTKGSFVSDVAFSPDGRTLALADWNQTVRLVDLQTHTERVLHGYGRSVKTVVFSPDGRTVVAGGWGGKIMAWDIATGKITKTLSGHTADILGVAFHPKGALLASSSWDHTVRIWDFETSSLRHTLTGHQGIAWDVAFSPDGSQLASASDDGTVGLWETTSWTLTATIRGHDGAVLGVAFSPGGSSLASASWDGDVKLWDLTRSQFGESVYLSIGHYRQLAFRPDGGRLAAVMQPLAVQGGDGFLTSHDPHTGRQMSVIDRRPGGFQAITFDSASRFLAADWGHEIRLWDAQTEKPLRDLKGHDSDVTALAMLSENSLISEDILISGADDGTLKLWRPETGELLHTLESKIGSIKSIATQTQGDYFAVGGGDAKIAVWEFTKTGPVERPMLCREFSSVVQSLAFSPTEQTLVAACEDGTVRVWSLLTGTELHASKGHVGAVSSVSFSPDGRRLASGGADGTVVLWDTKSGQESLTLRRQLKNVASVAFAPDGTTLAAVSFDTHQIHLWDSSARTTDDLANKIKNWHYAEANGAEALRRWTLAVRHLDALIDEDSSDVELLARRGNARAELGNYELALEDYRRVIEKMAGRPLDESSLRDFWSYCLLLLEAGDEEGYRQACRGLTKRFAEIKDSHIAGLATRCFQQLTDAHEIEPALKLIETLPLGNFEQAFNHAALLFLAGQPSKAHEAFKAASVLPNGDRQDGPYYWLWTAIVTPHHQSVSLVSFEKARLWLSRYSPSLPWKLRLETARLERLAERFVDSSEARVAREDILRQTRVEALTKLDEIFSKGNPTAADYKTRGNSHADLERWQEAMADFARACELSPNDMDAWYRRAAACLGDNDNVEHRRVVVGMLKQFGNTEVAGLANSVLYVLTTASDPPGEREQLLKLAFLAVNLFKGNERLVGATQYRLGAYTDAIDSFEQAEKGFQPRAWDYCFLAMCRHQLGDRTKAAAHLKQCDTLIEAAERAWHNNLSEAPVHWFNWQERAEVLHLRREAESLFDQLGIP